MSNYLYLRPSTECLRTVVPPQTHQLHIHTQVAYELAVGALAVALLWASSAEWPGHHARTLSRLAHLAALACVHLLTHTAVLAAGCRACARVGARVALAGGLVAICGYCHLPYLCSSVLTILISYKC